MPITITAFQASPDRGKGQARDMRVRWALEEVGQPYDVRFVSFDMMKQADHLALQPFGQIPTYEDGDIALFESGAIALHIAERYSGLLPTEANAHSRAVAWMFAALNTIEPPILDRETAQYTEVNQSWHTQRVPIMDERIRNRLNQLSRQLGDADWLDGAFSVGDLVMVGVLRRLSQSPLLSEFPNLVSYIARGEDRPAFKRAFAAQLKAYFRQLDET
jgi:glutathione S-transferase